MLKVSANPNHEPEKRCRQPIIQVYRSWIHTAKTQNVSAERDLSFSFQDEFIQTQHGNQADMQHTHLQQPDTIKALCALR